MSGNTSETSKLGCRKCDAGVEHRACELYDKTPTPPEGEADPEQVCKTCDGKGVVSDTETELVVDCPECDNPNPPLPREEWIPCPICQSEYDGVYCHACRNHPPAPVVSTAAPEPPSKCPTCGKRMTPTGGPHTVPSYRCFDCNPVAPESYKPAEGPEPLSYEQEIHSLLCAAASNTENLLEYFQIQAANEKGEAKKLTHKCIAWKREQLHRIREIIPKALAAKNKPTATPVTVEAPNGMFDQASIICMKLRDCADIPVHRRLTIVDQVLKLIPLAATPKPIGDVEARVRIIDRNEEPTCVQVKVEDDWYTVCKDINLDTALRVREVLKKFSLSPFFAPAGPEKEKK